jgi:hypothetical protein
LFAIQAFDAQSHMVLTSRADGYSRHSRPFGNCRTGLTCPVRQSNLIQLHDPTGQRCGVGEGLQLLNAISAEQLERHQASQHFEPLGTKAWLSLLITEARNWLVIES